MPGTVAPGLVGGLRPGGTPLGFGRGPPRLPVIKVILLSGLAIVESLHAGILLLVEVRLSRVLAVVDEIVRRLSGASLNGEEPGQELLRSIEDSQLQGELDEDAATLLENVVEFGTTDVGAVMTPSERRHAFTARRSSRTLQR